MILKAEKFIYGANYLININNRFYIYRIRESSYLFEAELRQRSLFDERPHIEYKGRYFYDKKLIKQFRGNARDVSNRIEKILVLL